MIHGIINVFKDAGFTSHDVVAKLRGITKQRKIGHTGTLDPDAVGVLPVCLGSATRLCDMLTDKRKSYRAMMLLGRITDTQDTSGETLEERPVNCTEEEVRAVLESFLGDQMQVPPMYSALQVNGKRLYELAREGKIIEREARPVHFYEINFLYMDGREVEFEVTCSKGTYIRTLCADIGEKLGCGACMSNLMRYQVDRFGLENSWMLSELQQLAEEGRLMEAVTPVDHMFTQYEPRTVSEGEGAKLLANGNPLSDEHVKIMEQDPAGAFDTNTATTLDGQIYRLYDREGKFQALYQYDASRKDGKYRVYRIFFQD